MTDCKKPIRRSMLRIGIFFISILALLISLQTAVMIRTSMYERYDAHLEDVLTYVEGGLDLEDLRECIETKVPSEKFYALQRDVNQMVDDFELLYLYICIPVNDGQGTMTYVVASTSEAERAAGDTEDWPLMYVDHGYFTADQMVPYLEAWEKSPEMSIFESKYAFGTSRTVCKPLLTAGGETMALLCADLAVDEVHRQINTYIGYSVALILLISLAFSVGVAFWLRRNVTEPLRALEKSARGFAEKSHGKNDPELLAFDAPELRVNNEIRSLSDAITQMSEDMRDYVEGTLAAEKRAAAAEQEAEGLALSAYEDPLTGLMSKIAFEAKKEDLAQEIADGKAKFAVVMIDLNNLKRINDTYGAEKGSRYIVSGSRIISEVYASVPIYRVGGDEFIVVLEDESYQNRYELFDLLEEKFADAQVDMSRELWERCSAAAGMTEFFADSDGSVDQVYRRAEKIMIRNKRLMKNETY